MTLISIQEEAEIGSGWKTAIRIDNGPKEQVMISNPFSAQEEQELEWYFEEHLTFPFTQKVRARLAAASIATYGEMLFQQVFSTPDSYADYRNIRESGLSDLRIEIEGSPKFHSLHWEALKDPKLPLPLALQAIIIRKNIWRQTVPTALRPSPIINLLIVTARPAGKRDIGYRTISRPLVEELGRANLPIQVDILRPGTYRALENHLRNVTEQHGEGYYHVMHFDVHGAVLSHEQLKQGKEANHFIYHQRYARDELQPYENVKAFLSFESEQQDPRADLVEASELAALLATHHVPIAILNACQSGKQIGERETSLGSHLVQAGVQFVLAMGYSVTVSAAELLMKTLYEKLFVQVDLPVAIRDGRTELYNRKERRAYFDQMIDLEDWLLPVVYQNQPVTLQTRTFTLEERSNWFERKAEENRYTQTEPTYGFVGRDIDILQIEKRLLMKHNILLIRGMGGAGKTTLLKHLRVWWHTTGFVQRIFYFGYDEKAWTLQQVMTELAQQLYGHHYSTDFQPLSLTAQQAMLAQELRSDRHLLILDNLESITGSHLAIRHVLSKAEQEVLRRFLADLSKGRTLVLLGSRSSEEWLAQGTFEENIYDLSGLDPEAASMLAERILEKMSVTRYREDEDLRTIIKVLDGFPLALEVVLANLANQTPQEVLTALRAGDVNLDISANVQQGKSIFEQKTESILRCIDYSHSNLSPEAQSLFLCLAPFTSVFLLSTLELYTSHLKQQPILADLPYELWPEVVAIAEDWGLLRHDPNNPNFLHLQPTFPYFLRTRLVTLRQTDVRDAIEAAYREHYTQFGGVLRDLLQSKEPQEQNKGRILIQLEYENLMTALELALTAQTGILGLYLPLDDYLDTIYDSHVKYGEKSGTVSV